MPQIKQKDVINLDNLKYLIRKNDNFNSFKHWLENEIQEEETYSGEWNMSEESNIRLKTLKEVKERLDIYSV